MDHSGHGSMSSNDSMSGMDGMSGMMGMDHMLMTFFTSTSTALYADSWMPANPGQYAGTCIFLILLAALFRGIVAVRTNFPALLTLWAHRRDTSLLRPDFDEDGKWMLVGAARRPWNINEALARAVLDTILAGVSYLLMLAVMTMNVGYFMSILGGTFLGSFVIGDWQPTAAHCDGH
ncbi:Putative Ctr copper transporter [Septoria linicola]|uniref:Copper transport protein n=1 Tax=Septoria linicola TaxID=215465 RepID=A0A9Q9B894_9PEZI|nr:Putative Ctr copper transporter [Septoria linicola]